MYLKDIQVGKVYAAKRGQRIQTREVLEISDFEHATMSGLVKGKRRHDDEKVVQYRTNGVKPKIVYMWITVFADWAGRVVDNVRRVVTDPQSSQLLLQLTDEVRQDANSPTAAVAYLVFTTGAYDYKVCTEQSEAVSIAIDVAVQAGEREWRVYPLYAGLPITG